MATDMKEDLVKPRWRRLGSIQLYVLVSVLGVLASTFFLYYRVSTYRSTRENLVWVGTAAEIELARYGTALLRVASTAGRSTAALADAQFRFEILLSRLGLYEAGQVHAAMTAHPDGPAVLARIRTIEAAIDPARIADWTPEQMQALESRIAVAVLILREASLILLRREEVDGRDLLQALDASVVVSGAFVVVGALLLLSLLRARGEAQRTAELARAAAEAARHAAAERRAMGRLLDILEHLPVAILTTGPDSTIRWINAAAREIFGIEPDRAKGRALSDFLPPLADTTGMGAAALRAAVAADPLRTTALRSDGTAFPAEAVVAASDAPGEASLVWMVRDITQQVLHERRRQEVEADKRRAQRLESLGTLAGGIAHELNSPIQFLTDNTDFLRNAFADMAATIAELRAAVPMERYAEIEARFELGFLLAEIPQAVAQSRSGLERIADIVQATRRFLHPASAAMEDNDINQIVQTAVLLSRNQWRYVADLDLELAADLPRARSNAGELNQVLLNLIVNAVHAIEDRGGGMGRILISTRRAADGVECSVSDSGIGIAPELREKVFDLFFTTKGPGRGTGQGLALVHSIVTQVHGGRIGFESEPGNGTTFRFTLPATPAARDGEAPPPGPAPAMPAPVG
jgi:PAS domain S-box-containing protein